MRQVHWTSLQSDQHLRGPHIARQQQLSIDTCCPRPTSAANPPLLLLLLVSSNGTDRHSTVLIIIIIVILRVLTSSFQLPLKLPGHGTRWLLNWFKRLADGSHLSPRTEERQYFCSSACPFPFNGEMQSPSSARSLPPINHPLQSFLA